MWYPVGFLFFGYHKDARSNKHLVQSISSLLHLICIKRISVGPVILALPSAAWNFHE